MKKPRHEFKFLIARLLGILILCQSRPLAASADSSMVFVALGDSTTAGTPAFRSPRETPPAGAGNAESQYAYWISKIHPEWRIINQGVNRERLDQILKRFDADVLSFYPKMVIVLAGVNDLYQGHSAEEVEAGLKRIYDRAVENGIKVMACTILPYNTASKEVRARMAEVNEWIRSTVPRMDCFSVILSGRWRTPKIREIWTRRRTVFTPVSTGTGKWGKPSIVNLKVS